MTDELLGSVRRGAFDGDVLPDMGDTEVGIVGLTTHGTDAIRVFVRPDDVSALDVVIHVVGHWGTGNSAVDCTKTIHCTRVLLRGGRSLVVDGSPVEVAKQMGWTE